MSEHGKVLPVQSLPMHSEAHHFGFDASIANVANAPQEDTPGPETDELAHHSTTLGGIDSWRFTHGEALLKLKRWYWPRTQDLTMISGLYVCAQ